MTIDKNKLCKFYIFLVIILPFVFNTYFLESVGIQYVSEGGAQLFKLHLYTYVIIAFYPFFTSSINSELFLPYKKAWTIFLFSLLYTIGYGYITAGMSGLAYTLDSLLIPLLFFPVAVALSQEVKIFALKILFLTLAFNSATAIYEYTSGVNVFMPYVEDGIMYYFRANGFLSHPLNNALITASIVPLLMRGKVLKTYFIVFVTLLGLLSFGARTASAFFIVACIAYFLHAYSLAKRGVIRPTEFEISINIISLLVGLLVIILAIIKLDVGARVFENLMIDGSAQTRFDVYRVFSYLSFSEIIFGANPELFDNIELYIDNLIIENFVVSWILKYGVLGSLFLVISFYYFFLKMYHLGSFQQKVAVIVFVIISFSNNSLSSKTAALLLFFIAYSSLVKRREIE